MTLHFLNKILVT